jgi:hypothetical protein
MTSAAELRAEAQRIRDFALTVTDEEVLAGLQEFILELKRRARELGNGDAQGSREWRAKHDISSDPAERRSLQRRDDQPQRQAEPNPGLS